MKVVDSIVEALRKAMQMTKHLQNKINSADALIATPNPIVHDRCFKITKYFLIPSSGNFGVRVVGQKFYNDNVKLIIDKAGANAKENGILLFSIAQIKFENDNIHDSNAVSISLHGLKIGYLSTDYAENFRSLVYSEKCEYEIFCAIVIYGGWVTNYREYDYAIELDLDLIREIELVKHVEDDKLLLRVENPDITVLSINGKECYLEIPFIRSDVVSACNIGLNIDCWRIPDSGDLILYPPGPGGGGPRLATLKMSTHSSVIEFLLNSTITIHSKVGRILIAKAVST